MNAASSGALDECPGEIGGVRLSVGWQERSPQQVRRIQDRAQLECFFGCQKIHLKPKGMRHGNLALDFPNAFFVAGQPQPAVHLPAGCLTGFLLELGI